jgi:hypothetical protein
VIRLTPINQPIARRRQEKWRRAFAAPRRQKEFRHDRQGITGGIAFLFANRVVAEDSTSVSTSTSPPTVGMAAFGKCSPRSQ